MDFLLLVLLLGGVAYVGYVSEYEENNFIDRLWDDQY